jgi:hypothetical protein
VGATAPADCSLVLNNNDNKLRPVTIRNSRRAGLGAMAIADGDHAWQDAIRTLRWSVRGATACVGIHS